MKLSELMQGHLPSPNYEGVSTADDMVLALDISRGASTPAGEYLVAQGGIKEHSGALNPQTQSSQYLRTGQTTIKTGNQRVISVKGDRILGDLFQEFALSHEIKFGVGSTVVIPYIYFNILTGKGEKGNATLLVEDEPGGSAGENATFGFTLNTVATPAEFCYTAG